MAHVVSAVLGGSGPLLLKLAGLLAGQYGRLKGVSQAISALKNELSTMVAALQKYSMLEHPDVQVKEWMSIVRELAYDIEDHIDKFIHRLGNGGRRARHQGMFKEFFHNTSGKLKALRARNGLANKIDELNVRINQAKELKNGYKVDDASSRTANHIAVDPRLPALFAEKAQLVGIDGPREDLVKWMEEGSGRARSELEPVQDMSVSKIGRFCPSKPLLEQPFNTTASRRCTVGAQAAAQPSRVLAPPLEEGNMSSKHRRVLSIVGFGGSGKTTLANEIYRKIEGHFDCRAIVSISQKPDMKKIMKDVFSQVSNQDEFTEGTVDDWDERKYITKLRELLQAKRYLIIIDDIWSEQAWKNIQCAFPGNNCSSRIIVTTRIIDVAKSCCSGDDDRIYEIKALSDLHSRSLFFKRFIHFNGRCPDMLKEVSDKILKKCGGLPLAIISISGLLANRPAVKEEWEKVERLIGSALENNHSLEGMTSILCLSYNDLPHNLKTCFLYLSVFPEDYVIGRERLVRRWVAEGFVSGNRGQSQYEVAEGYFYELINKNMVQPVDINSAGKVHACLVHDMMREIIVSKSVEENFITVLDGGQTGLSNRHGIIRRLSVQYIDHDLSCALANEDLSHVRSLTVTASDCIKHLPKLAKFKALRVLDFEGCEGLEQYDMDSVERLFQLKYLGLKDTGISKLPSRIVMLSALETIDFRNTSVQELPAGFFQLTKLQYLLGGRLTKIPSGIGIMNNLRVIYGINATMSMTDALEDLGNLTSLTVLRLFLDGEGSECGEPDEYRRHEEKLFSSLHKLIGRCKLRSLYIDSADGHSLELLESWSPMESSIQNILMDTKYYFRNIPEWIAPLTTLARLDISLTELTKDGLHTLGELPSLVFLVLVLEAGEDRINIVQGGFPSLKFFNISSKKGTYVKFMQGAMPKVGFLYLKLALLLGRNNGFYLGIGNLPCLKHVWIEARSEGATESEIIAATAAVREEESAHSNHPRVDIDLVEI